MNTALYVGLMSGTSMDAIDCALVRCGGSGHELIATREHPIPDSTRGRIVALSRPGDNEIDQMGALDRELGQLFADGVAALLASSATDPSEVRAVGSHGQTIRHRPPSANGHGSTAFTLQIADPNTIAEKTGITTVADFRRRDIAAGGEGAPLAPALHAAAFAKTGQDRCILNIGGIANITLLKGEQLLAGFDTGPGNTLLDQWVLKHRGSPFDRYGAWAAEGEVNQALLDGLLAHEYFSRSGPRSTGKEMFNLPWLMTQLQDLEDIPAIAVQATLAELTAVSVARVLEAEGFADSELYVCGGGAHNKDLMKRLQRQLPETTLATTQVLGTDPDWVEAVSFAWLAHRTLEGLSGNAPAVTGAMGVRILGGIYPA